MHVERKPVLEGGEFVWGDVLVSGNRPEGTPISALVARLLAALDGRRSLAEALEDVVADLPRIGPDGWARRSSRRWASSTSTA